jgi:mTERF domain-containing protein
MGLTHRQLVQWPKVFSTRLHIIKQRHRFLLLLHRAQYDETKENYVSLQALVSGRDAEFCAKVAKVPVDQYKQFLKCI